ncbi:MAG TPA: allantoinase AllB [Gemmatimonadales bacterium]|nr:allantoinase AllB [Gemmatimonadales bacterium]
MKPDLVISSGRVVTPEGERPGAVVVARGRIIAIVPPGEAPSAAETLDVGAAALLPGLVDSHVHVNEPGRTAWEGFATATRAAAAGGVTTIVDMPLNSVPPTTTVPALEAKARAADGQAMVDYAFWGGVVPENLDDLQPLTEAGVLGFKCFLVPSGVDEFPHLTESDLVAAMHRLAELDRVLLAHAELPGPIAEAGRSGADPRHYTTWLAARPRAAELEAIDLLLLLSLETGCRVHIVHLSCAAALDRIANARRAGARVTVETCPHYLTFAAEDIPDGQTAFKCAPPVRERENRERLWQGLAHGAIDLVASDHSPAPPALKHLDTGDFLAAWGGIASLELSLSATWTGARARRHGLPALARWLSQGPAHLAGLNRKGRIAPGFDADLVVFDPGPEWTVDPARLHQRHPVTPYAGLALRGKVLRTFLRGTCVYEEGRFPAPPGGTWLRREERSGRA